MWSTEQRIRTKANKETIWQLWADVQKWNIWDKDIDYSSIDGRFDVGTLGILKPVNGPMTKFKITEAISNNHFTSKASLFLSSIYFIHEMIDVKNGEVIVVHRIEIRGLLSGLFSRIIGRNMAKGLHEAVSNLVNMAENGE